MTKNKKDLETKGFNQEELAEAIDEQKVQIKRENFRLKIKEVNNYFAKTKVFNFTKSTVW
ncbi:Uncharacterised protein, partial [Mycoplasma putrefaciens]